MRKSDQNMGNELAITKKCEESGIGFIFSDFIHSRHLFLFHNAGDMATVP